MLVPNAGSDVREDLRVLDPALFSDDEVDEAAVRAEMAELQRRQEDLARRLKPKPLAVFAHGLATPAATRPLAPDTVFSFLDTIPKRTPVAADYTVPATPLALDKVYLPETAIAQALSVARVLCATTLLAKVTPPSFSPPKYPNWCVCGIVVAKHDPKPTAKGSDKFIKISLWDYSHTVDLNLFGAAFKRFNRLAVGDAIAVLNPDVWAYKPPGGTARTFNLLLRRDTNCVLELGHAKHLGRCPETKRDNTRCNAPIHAGKALVCDFHAERKYKRARLQRMEFNSTPGMFAPRDHHGNQQLAYLDKHGRGQLLQDGAVRASQSDGNLVHFSSASAGRAFFSDEYLNPQAVANLDAKRRGVEAARKERQLRERLSRFKGGHQLRPPLTEQDEAERAQVAHTAFNPHALEGIGFDPTNRSATARKHNTKAVEAVAAIQKLLQQARDSLTKVLTRERKASKRPADSDSDSEIEITGAPPNLYA